MVSIGRGRCGGCQRSPVGILHYMVVEMMEAVRSHSRVAVREELAVVDSRNNLEV